MNVGYISDIHFDMGGNCTLDWFDFETADVIIIAGDVGTMNDAYKFIERLASKLPASHIIFVPGNHEYCNDHHQRCMNELDQFFIKEVSAFDNVSYLPSGQSITIRGVKFIGGTGWSDLGRDYSPNIELICKHKVQTLAWDFDSIVMRSNDNNVEYITCEEMQHLFDINKKNIISELDGYEGRSVVITHFAPGIEFRNEYFKLDNESYYFSGKMTDVIEKYQPNYWIYGHTHGRCNMVQHGDTIVLCNQQSTINRDYSLKYFQI